MTRDFLAFLGEAAEYGDIAAFHVWRQPIVLINHPDLIRDVLVTMQHKFHKGIALERARVLLGRGLLTSEGELHTRQQRVMQPAFHRARVAHYATMMTEQSGRTSDTLRPGVEFDMHRAMGALTLSIVTQALFTTDVSDATSTIARALSNVLSATDVLRLPFAGIVQHLPLPMVRRFRRGKRHLDLAVEQLIAERRARADLDDDLLSMLFAADPPHDGGQVHDEVMTLLLAGHETTANALTWTWYLLSLHPDVESRVHAEADALAGTPLFEDRPRLEYTRRVVTEAMRLYPPAYAIGRRAIESFKMGGFTFSEGTLVLVSQFLQHRDPRWFAEPTRFDPDRWLPDEAAKRPRFSFFPFGAGSRACIGEHFAWTELVLVVAALARRWRFLLVPGQEVAAQAQITLRPRRGLRMVAERRG